LALYGLSDVVVGSIRAARGMMENAIWYACCGSNLAAGRGAVPDDGPDVRCRTEAGRIVDRTARQRRRTKSLRVSAHRRRIHSGSVCLASFARDGHRVLLLSATGRRRTAMRTACSSAGIGPASPTFRQPHNFDAVPRRVGRPAPADTDDLLIQVAPGRSPTSSGCGVHKLGPRPGPRFAARSHLCTPHARELADLQGDRVCAPHRRRSPAAFWPSIHAQSVSSRQTHRSLGWVSSGPGLGGMWCP
jgi:hypothetical protein